MAELEVDVNDYDSYLEVVLSNRDISIEFPLCDLLGAIAKREQSKFGYCSIDADIRLYKDEIL